VLAAILACDEDLYKILNESLSGSAHGSVGSVGSGDNDEVARPPGHPVHAGQQLVGAKVPEITHVLTGEPSLRGADQAARLESRQPRPAERV
jgi:hypothetical protein